jgi:hypothetical protein
MSDLQRQVAEMITGGGCVTDYWDEALETAEKVISLVRSDMDDFWISADECVPPNDDLVLVRCKRAILGEFDRVVTWFAYYGDSHGGKQYWFDGASDRYQSIREVTHWMPLPDNS